MNIKTPIHIEPHDQYANCLVDADGNIIDLSDYQCLDAIAGKVNGFDSMKLEKDGYIKDSLRLQSINDELILILEKFAVLNRISFAPIDQLITEAGDLLEKLGGRGE